MAPERVGTWTAPRDRAHCPSQPARQRYGEVMAREPQGRFLGLPYNWRRPTPDEAGKGVWDPDDRRILTPKNYGWGYGINFAALKRRFTRR